jgi:hypothetical protein
MQRGYKKVFAVIGGLDEMPQAGFLLQRGNDIIQYINGKPQKVN